MKKEVILVPKDKCPLDVLAEMGEKIRNAWIFIHKNAIEILCETAEDILVKEEGVLDAFWEHPRTNIIVQAHKPVWSKVYEIKADDISFTVSTDDPEDIFFLKMEEDNL